ncbi:MAG TPA: type II toxin-antitoxin system VapC family toxin [Ignavibacteria bacterium]|nr:type II toxin-antitoxin system VapC family toxin [Ignavibacteria bacterium]
MNGNRILADTNIIIYLLNGNISLSELLENKRVYLSFISEIELFCSKSLNNTEIKHINNLLEQCIIVDVNSIIKQEAIFFRKKYNLKIPDALIASAAKYHNIPILTSDSAFKKISEINIFFYEVS